MLDVEIHPAADLFPMMTDREFGELLDDIRANGQRVPITYWRGQLLDGRNRYRACQELGVDPEEEELDDSLVPDPVAWVLSTNLHRRHLTETQREVIAAKIANLKRGDNQYTKEVPQSCGPSSTDEASQQLNVKPRSVEHAKAAIKGGCKELVEAMERDEITSSLASNFVKAVPDKRKQKTIVKEGVDAVRQAVKDFKSEKKIEQEVNQPKQSTDPMPSQPTPPPDRARKRLPEIVSAFRRSESKASDLRALVDDLDAHYVSLIKEWLTQ